MTADFKRLGKRGSYRLGRLRTQGVGERQGVTLFRPRFSRMDHRWPASHWLLGLLGGVLLIAAGAVAGWWFMPFAVGLLAGGANWIGGWPGRVALPAVALTAAAGWAVPLWWAVLRGQPYGPVAREVAALDGLPGHASAGLVLTLLIAAAQALAGYWLGRALTPRSAGQ
jgi:hypothetical protein